MYCCSAAAAPPASPVPGGHAGSQGSGAGSGAARLLCGDTSGALRWLTPARPRCPALPCLPCCLQQRPALPPAGLPGCGAACRKYPPKRQSDPGERGGQQPRRAPGAPDMSCALAHGEETGAAAPAEGRGGPAMEPRQSGARWRAGPPGTELGM